jgi:hypothetical protein
VTESGEPERRIAELNWLGKAVFLAGTGVRYTAELLDSAIERIAEVVASTEKAFKQGLDPNIEEAKIVEESDAMNAEGGRRNADLADSPVGDL